MPSTYAHYRFGQRLLPELPPQVRKSIQHFSSMYYVGLHGPDFLFFSLPMFHTNLSELGSAVHRQTGKEFFGSAAELLRANPSEGAEAYLYGVLGHFALDSHCHPLIKQSSEDGHIGHVELETEFDRYLLETDGVKDPHLADTSSHLHLTLGECAQAAQFYPMIGAPTVRFCLLTMRLFGKVQTIRNRDLLTKCCSLGGRDAVEMVMYPGANRNCSPLIRPLLAQYQKAAECYPRMTSELYNLIHQGAPLGDDFNIPFG